MIAVEFAVAIVAFGCARWGRAVTVVLSGLSIPAAAAVGYVVAGQDSPGVFRGLALFREIRDSAYRFSDTLLVGATILGLLILAVPWLAGLVLRATARARRSEVQTERAEADAARAQHETEQAREIARLREEQAQLARDVHDVVGHSLAVILAQAESGQYLPDDDPAALKKTMATIASSARSSLQDVRQVLSRPGLPAPARTGAFEQLRRGGPRRWSRGGGDRGRHAAAAAAGARRGRAPGGAGDAHQRHQARPPRPAGVRRAALAGGLVGPRPADRGPQRRGTPTGQRRGDPAAPGRPVPRARGSRGCAGGWSRWAAGSTYAAGTRTASRPSRATAWVPVSGR